jgi:hypothetical protein
MAKRPVAQHGHELRTANAIAATYLALSLADPRN